MRYMENKSNIVVFSGNHATSSRLSRQDARMESE